MQYNHIGNLVSIKQEPKYHPEGDVWNHTMLVIDEAAKLRHKSNNALVFMLAALCHDFGKITTTAEVNGKIIAYGHDNQPELLDSFFTSMNVTNIELINDVKLLVKNHMRINSDSIILKGSNKAIRKLIKDSKGKTVNIYDLLLLGEADHRGRDFQDDYLDYSKQREWMLDIIKKIQ